MSVESSLPNRHAEWDAQAAETQTAVNELLARLLPEIRDINSRITELCDRNEIAMVNELVGKSLQYLNSQWPYVGDHFYVSGKLYTPYTSLSVEGVLMSHEQRQAATPVRSEGFVYKPYSDSSGVTKVRIGYSFSYAQATPVESIYGRGSFLPLAYADVDDDLSLLYLRPGGQEVVSSDQEQIIDRIERARAVTDLYLHDPRSSFYDSSARKQQKFFLDTTRFVEEVLPNPDTFDKLSVQVATHELSWKGLEGSLQTLSSTSPEVTYQIAGMALGATSRNILPDDEIHRFTSPEDLVDEKGDICLIVEPAAVNFPLTPGVTQEFIVPVTSAETFETKLV